MELIPAETGWACSTAVRLDRPSRHVMAAGPHRLRCAPAATLPLPGMDCSKSGKPELQSASGQG